MAKTAVELIDWKIKQHTTEAEKHERSVSSYENLADKERAAAKIYRDLIDELEESKSILERSSALPDSSAILAILKEIGIPEENRFDALVAVQKLQGLKPTDKMNDPRMGPPNPTGFPPTPKIKNKVG